MKVRVLATVTGLIPAAASAASQDQQVGARTKAMGGSCTAFEDDPVSKERGPNDTTLFSEEAKTVMADPEIVPSFLGFVTPPGSADSPLAHQVPEGLLLIHR